MNVVWLRFKDRFPTLFAKPMLLSCICVLNTFANTTLLPTSGSPSVTIPDVVCVIDTGRVREVRRNKRTSTSMLVMDWVPKSSSKQRQGRAGRVQPGLCKYQFAIGIGFFI